MSLALQPIVYGTGHIGLLSPSHVACLFQPIPIPTPLSIYARVRVTCPDTALLAWSPV